MNVQALRRMTEDEFFAWGERQEDRYEFVDGIPVRMMSGASRRHDQIVVNVLLSLGNQLRGGPCRPFTADTAVATLAGRLRRPDVGVECGARQDESYKAGEPRLVVEVLSPSTREFNLFGKLDEYKAVPSLDAILLVDPNAPQCLLWAREADGSWAHRPYDGLEQLIDLPALGVALPLAEIYADLAFPPRLPDVQ